ncbi:MAG: lipase secretion chaperone [Candidatus Moranbacteria bacterium]|nr:lipase secretion chaperone [Candidatus Moranbacteria bacterium]
MRQSALFALCGLGALAAALWWWQPAADGTPQTGSASKAGTSTVSASSQGAPALTVQQRLAAATAEQDALLTPGLRDALEALLLEAGDAPNPEALKQRLAALVARHFGDALSTRALALAERYVDFRVALGELQPPSDANDPKALRAAIVARDALRRQYFDDAEYEALFAGQENLERYTLARLDIERDPSLSDTQRREALEAAQTELSPVQRAERARSVVQVDVAAETADFNARGVDAHARYAERSTRYGDDAARRLAQIDTEDQQWNARLDDYARAQAAHASAEQLAQWRTRNFTEQEQLRLDAALQLRAQAAR